MVKLADRPGVTKVYYWGSNLAPGQTVTIFGRLGGGYNLELGGYYSGGGSNLFTPVAPKTEERPKELPAERVPGEPMPQAGRQPIQRDSAEPDLHPPWRP
jgi:hypothetical protein